MTRLLFTSTVLCGISCLTAPAASANDIINFLRAIQGPPAHHHQADTRVRSASHHRSHHASSRRDVHDRHHDHGPISRGGRSQFAFNVQFGTAPQLTVAPVPTCPTPHPVLNEPPHPDNVGHLPHELGQIVDCFVPLESAVRIKDLDEVAPGAVPVIIAVRDPRLRRFGSRHCVEQLVYVEVLVPRCPLQKLRVSPCKTKIRLGYGKYEVDIISRNGFVEIDYDN